MEPIYNRHHQVAWHKDTHTYHLNGNHEHAYCQKCQHLGTFKGYFFCDYRGGVVAFKPGTKGSPLPPISEIPPILPFPAISPILEIPSIPPLPGISSLSWAAMNWQQFTRP